MLVYLTILKGGAAAVCHSGSERVERMLRAEMKGSEMHTDGCWQFSSPLKGHVVLLATVLVSHSLIVP